MANHEAIRNTADELVTKIKAHEAAKHAYQLAQQAANVALTTLEHAHAAEVEAHEALRQELNSRRKTRRA